MAIDLQVLHSALGGEICNGQVLCPGPGHSPKDRSLAVRPTSTGFVVHSFSGDDFRDCQSHVRQRLGLPQWRGAQQQPSPRVLFGKSNDDPSRTKRAQEIWEQGRDPRGTAVEQYLDARKLVLPPELCGEVLRFHPQCPWKDDDAKETKFIPCLLAAFTSIDSDEITAIHRIRLDQPDRWPKTERKMVGITAGAAIRLDAAEQRLHIGEGLETCLAARQLGFKPAWAMGSARFSKLAPLADVQTLVILGERDAASCDEANRCAEVWMEQNKEVYLVLPKGSSNDFNDFVMEAGQ